MKKFFAVLFTVLMLFSLTACQGGSNADLEAMKMQMQLMQQQLDEAKKAGFVSGEQQPAPAETPQPEVVPQPVETIDAEYVLAINSVIDGETVIPLQGAETFTAEAIIPEGMAVERWEVNGMPYHEDMEPTFTFTAEGNTVVEARLRPEFKVTAINAEMQFLDAKGKPKGDAFTEFVFEEDYENPVTKETLPGGWITVNVQAVVPKGYAVDYWLINDVPYYYNRTVSNFTVYDLNEATVYEVVLKKENAPSSTPKPTAKPTSTPYYYEPAPEPTPEPTPEPVYYSVSCEGCTFSGGGYSGATSGRVPAGTVITVTSIYHELDSVYWVGSITDGSYQNDGGGAKSHTYTVNGDCNFICRLIVN